MSKKTVYVIGAGASQEARLPTGHELKSKISNLLSIRFDDDARQKGGDVLITEALRALARTSDHPDDISPYLKAAWHIRDALPLAISIDNFLDTHRDNAEIAICGKLAIVRSILTAEKSSLLYFDRSRSDSSINLHRLEDTWYLSFFKLLVENCTKDDLEDRLKSIVFIIFNYDRCVEHFIYHALKKYYKVLDDEAAHLVSHMNIYHPYGSVGSLPGFVNGDSDTVEFGADLHTSQLLQLIKKIKTFAEGTDPKSSDISAIKGHMKPASRLVFMGFAFHKLNMQLIAPNTKSVGLRRSCYATTFNISKSDEEVIRKQINELYSNAIVDTKMTDVECAKFFSEYWRSLAFK